MDQLNARQSKLLDLLRSTPTMKVREIQARFNVSQPTVYRDLRQLIDAGLIVRLGGSVHLAKSSQTPASNTPKCVYCHGIVLRRQLFQIENKPNELLYACCPHCGFLALKQHPNAISAMATDFIYGNIVNARQAAYLVNSQVILCCAPSVFSFTRIEDAQNFQRGFGGHIFSFEEASQHLHKHGSLIG